MPSRYYFLSSLPMLRFSAGAPVSWDLFISSARGNVSDSDLELLRAIGEDASDSVAEPFLRKWSAMNRAVSDAVNLQRKKNLGRTVDSFAVFNDYDTEKITAAVMNAKNPLEAELLLMRFYYDWLETQKGFEPFSRTALLVYALELRILIRKDLFTAESGNGEYRRLFDIVQRDIRME